MGIIRSVTIQIEPLPGDDGGEAVFQDTAGRFHHIAGSGEGFHDQFFADSPRAGHRNVLAEQVHQEGRERVVYSGYTR